jgi:hypothetical protein
MVELRKDTARKLEDRLLDVGWNCKVYTSRKNHTTCDN